MNNPVLINGNMYLPITLEEQQANLQASKNVYFDETELYYKLLDLKKKSVGSTNIVSPGYERVLEFDASKLVDMDQTKPTFKERYAEYTDYFKKRFELYPFADYGNGFHTDLFKPEFDDDKKAFVFWIHQPKAGNPTLTNVFDSPLMGDGSAGWDAKGPKNIKLNTRFQASFDMEISNNFWQHFKTVVKNTTARWCTFWQFKSSRSYYLGMVLGLLWDWSDGDNPSFVLTQQGDSSVTQRPVSEWTTRNMVRKIPMLIGEKQRFELEIEFDATGKNSYTKVERNNEVLLENTIPNCFPMTDDSYPAALQVKYGENIPQIRGMYFGGYFGAKPYTLLPEPISVHYTNFSFDVKMNNDNNDTET